jgi:transcriptional regulator with XRE-family HTH domain
VNQQAELAAFLRSRRQLLRPEDVGLAVSGRRRVTGLRREEVALLANMSTNYYERLERGRAPRPSPSLLAGLARALRLTVDERDYLFRLADQPPPAQYRADTYVDPGLMHVLDSLAPTTAAFVANDLAYVLVQNALNVAILGSFAGRPGWDSNFLWRWFTDQPWRKATFDKPQHKELSRTYAADLRSKYARRSTPEAAALVSKLTGASEEFRTIWSEHDVDVIQTTRKTLLNAEVGRLEMECDAVTSSTTGQRLTIFRPRPGTDTRERLEKLRSRGIQAD